MADQQYLYAKQWEQIYLYLYLHLYLYCQWLEKRSASNLKN
jgi:hypothetical protein